LTLSFGVNAAPSVSGAGPPPLVTVATVIEQDVNPPAEYVGHVEAIQSVDLRARVEGFMEKVNFKEGSDVNAGDLLYVIEPAPYQAKVDAAKASLAQAQAMLTKARQYLHRAQTVRSGGISATDLDNAVAWDTPLLKHPSAVASGVLLLPEVIWLGWIQGRWLELSS
jgi:multidrug efflux pump subunit AcrA (membrane-fusion protein)